MNISIIGGGGRVGLPLAISLVNCGHHVTIIDSDLERVRLIKNRVMPFQEKDADKALQELDNNSFLVSNDQTLISKSEVCILIIGTPVLEDGTPGANFILELIEGMLPFLQSVKLLMLRSTVYPGITHQIQSKLTKNGLKTQVSYCPERIAEGVALEEIIKLPQIIGSDNQVAKEISESVFKDLGCKLINISIKEAELTKLFANSYRYIKFAIANEFFEISKNSDASWENIWRALKTDYPRASDLPLPGFAAGPCLVKDTMQLDYFVKGNFQLGKAALVINEKLPDWLVAEIEKSFNLSEMTVGILGMTFKGGVDDFRSSLSFRLRNLLTDKAKHVLCSDTLLQKDYFVSTEKLLQDSDLVVIATPHKEYANIQYNKTIIDIWRITNLKSLI